MSLSHAPKIKTDGLVFYYDMENTQKSWKGAPTININLDLPKMSVVFVNLLLNAIRFTPVEGTIQLTIDDRKDEIMVSISDNGRGISPDSLEKIFEVFYQEDDHMTRRYGGLGLGLSIARELVDLHGGRIWAESKGLGEGATFRVVLPKKHS